MFPKTTSMFYKRDTRAKAEGVRTMALSVKNAGTPSDNSKPHKIEPFVQRAITRSFEHGSKPATDSTKVKTHYAPRKEKK